MTLSTGYAARIRRNEPLPLPVSAFLGLGTPLTRLGMWNRLRKPVQRVPAYVISFGNLTVGGTGKTPAVIERAKEEIERGKRVGILTRGYKSVSRRKLTISADVSRADRVPLLGDEAALVLDKVPEAMVFACANRVEAARLAVERYGIEVLILDDGFQYTLLHRDQNVLLIDAACPFGNGCLIPQGLLREPIAAMARATSIVVTRCDQAGDLPGLLDAIREACPGTSVRKTVHRPTEFRRARDGICLPLDSLSGKEVVMACAIGNPDAFEATLVSLGAIVTKRYVYPDHTPIDAGELAKFNCVVVTEKDAIRIQDAPDNLFVLGISLADF